MTKVTLFFERLQPKGNCLVKTCLCIHNLIQFLGGSGLLHVFDKSPSEMQNN